MAAILLVDDEPSARATLALLLRKRAHRVIEAADVAAATKALADTAFEVVVTDLRMPDGDGLDVLGAGQGGDAARRLRLLREGPRAGRAAASHRARRGGQGAAAGEREPAGPGA